MIDFIKIGFNIQKESEVFVSAQKRFEDVTITYQIHSEKTDSPIITTFVTSDSIVIKKITYLINSLYKFYSEDSKLKGNYHYDFMYKNLCFAINRIIKQLPFLKSSEPTQLEFGFDFEKPIYVQKMKNKTALLFKGGFSKMAYQPLVINEVNKKQKCSNMSLKINLKSALV